MISHKELANTCGNTHYLKKNQEKAQKWNQKKELATPKSLILESQ
jgi:hypothetical protein